MKKVRKKNKISKIHGNTPDEINLRVYKKLSRANVRMLKYRWWLYESGEHTNEEGRLAMLFLGVSKFNELKMELRSRLISNN